MWKSIYFSFPHRKFIKLSFGLLCFDQSRSMETLAASSCPSSLRFCLHLDVSWACVTMLVFEICPLGYGGPALPFWAIPLARPVWSRALPLLAPGLPPGLKTKPLLTDCSFLSCWKVGAADAMCCWKEAPCVPLCKWRCLSASLWCLFFAHREAGIQATSESSSLNRTWSSWSLFFLISKLGTLVRLTVFFVVVSLSFCRQTDETGQSWEQVSRVPASPHHIQWVSGVLTWEAGAGRAQACLPLMFLPLTHSAAFLTVWLSFSFPVGWLPPHSPHLPGGRWLPTAPSLQKATTYDTKAQATKEQNR